MSVDFCPQFLYFILNYFLLVFNSTGVGISILSNVLIVSIISLIKYATSVNIVDVYVLYYCFHDSYIFTVTMLFHNANSTIRTLMFFTV